MAHSAGKTLFAVLLLVTIAAVVGGRIHGAESGSVGDYHLFPCKTHPSGNYKGPCVAFINDKACNRVCLGESSDHSSGECSAFKCICTIRCTSETVAAASAPIAA
ncbi:hypothetical protein SETIT_8G232300v2 [Setaria italica]|uniref:Knottins-like domain-containing protein n=1 Tax=Setaria italica TaxID=4555 RepID=A0A368SB12_SETIT|nr:hypothetical protein SETIT_8G232300v2 [Setaria italica]